MEIELQELRIIKSRKGEKRGSAKDKALTPDEKKLLLDKLTDQKDRIILILCSFAGLRIGEAIQVRKEWLRWTTIDNNKRIIEINIPAEDKNIIEGLRVWRTKNRKARTTIILNEALASEVFTFYNSGLEIGLTERAIFKRIAKKWTLIINRSNLCPHALRSTAINYMVQELGLDPFAVQIMCGHENFKTTTNHYLSKGKPQLMSYLTKFITSQK